MPIRTIDMYAEDVLKKYQERAKLIEPTRTDIKEDCMTRFSKETKIADIEILRKFFRASYEDDLFKIIENSNPEKFRTIQNFLIKKTSFTSKKNLDVIAWLIDFNPRPYSLYRKPNTGGDSGIDIEFDDDLSSEVTLSKPEVIPEKEKEKEKEKGDEGDKVIPILISDGEPGKSSKKEDSIKDKGGEKNSKPKKWIRVAVSAVIISAMLFYGATYFSANGKTNTETEPTEENTQTNIPKKCMAWAETEYILADCTDSIHSKYKTKVIPYTKDVFKSLKKINVDVLTPFFEPNTVTPRIWYLKISGGKHEYFTAAGNHPVSGEFLSPITKGHIEKYIKKERKNNASSYTE